MAEFQANESVLVSGPGLAWEGPLPSAVVMASVERERGEVNCARLCQVFLERNPLDG